MNRRAGWLFVAALLTGACLSAPPPRSAAVQDATPGEAWSGLAAVQARDLLSRRPEALLLDVRTPGEWDGELGHIEGARLLPVQELAQRLAELEPWRERAVVIVCRSGNRSRHAAEVLSQAGFREVYNLEGGMIAWRGAGF